MEQKILLTTISTLELEKILLQALNQWQPTKANDEPRIESKELMTRKEAAAFLHVSLSTLNNYSKSGIVPKELIGGKVLYRRTDLLESLRRAATLNPSH